MDFYSKIRFKIALAKLKIAALTLDAWAESKHPRENDGRFAHKGSGSVSTKARKDGKVRTGRKVDRHPAAIRLGRTEYAHVVSELNTHLSKEERERPVLYKAIGNYVYTFENHGFDNYRFIRKERIK